MEKQRRGRVGGGMNCRAFIKRVSAGIGVATGVVLLAGVTLAEPLTSTTIPDGFTLSDMGAQPEATPATPVNVANLRGSLSSSGSISGACSGVTCSVGTCACTTFNGTLTGTPYGKVTAVIKITENDSNTTPTGGFGSCFPAAGTATLTTPGSSPSVAVLGLSGALCQFIAGSAFTVNGNFAYTEEAATGGTNKFATSFGTGNVSLMESVDQTASGVLPAQASVVGTLQLKH